MLGTPMSGLDLTKLWQCFCQSQWIKKMKVTVTRSKNAPNLGLKDQDVVLLNNNLVCLIHQFPNSTMFYLNGCSAFQWDSSGKFIWRNGPDGEHPQGNTDFHIKQILGNGLKFFEGVTINIVLPPL